jgi:hypothetical protein
MKSRRLMSNIGLPPPSPYPAGRGYQRGRGPQQSVCRTLSLPQRGPLVFGADLNCSESGGRSAPTCLRPPRIAHRGALVCFSIGRLSARALTTGGKTRSRCLAINSC